MGFGSVLDPSVLSLGMHQSQACNPQGTKSGNCLVEAKLPSAARKALLKHVCTEDSVEANTSIPPMRHVVKLTCALPSPPVNWK